MIQQNKFKNGSAIYLIAKEIIEQKLGIKALRGDISRLALLLKTIEEKSEQKKSQFLISWGNHAKRSKNI